MPISHRFGWQALARIFILERQPDTSVGGDCLEQRFIRGLLLRHFDQAPGEFCQPAGLRPFHLLHPVFQDNMIRVPRGIGSDEHRERTFNIRLENLAELWSSDNKSLLGEQLLRFD